MNIYSINREQFIELKVNYLYQLANEGTFAEVLGVDYHEPSWGDIARADEIVPDHVVYENFSCYEFSPDDFAFI